MGTAGGGISRHRPGRHPAARADRPGRRGGHRAVGLLRGIEIFVTARIRPGAGHRPLNRAIYYKAGPA